MFSALHRALKWVNNELKIVIRIVEIIFTIVEIVFRLLEIDFSSHKVAFVEADFGEKIAKSRPHFTIIYQYLSKIIGILSGIQKQDRYLPSGTLKNATFPMIFDE